jgi:cytochrome c553
MELPAIAISLLVCRKLSKSGSLAAGIPACFACHGAPDDFC